MVYVIQSLVNRIPGFVDCIPQRIHVVQSFGKRPGGLVYRSQSKVN